MCPLFSPLLAGARRPTRVRLQGLTAVGSHGPRMLPGQALGTRHPGNPQPTLLAVGVGPAKTEWGTLMFFPSFLLQLFG